MRVSGLDRTSLVAGLVTTVAGLILLLDRLDEIDLGLGYGMPLLIAAVGAILLLDRLEVIDLHLGYGMPLLIAVVGAIVLAAGLEGPRERG